MSAEKSKPVLLHSVTIKALQEKIDEGYQVDALVEYYHAELGTQKDILLDHIKDLVPSPGSPGAQLLQDKLESAAKALEDEKKTKDKK